MLLLTVAARLEIDSRLVRLPTDSVAIIITMPTSIVIIMPAETITTIMR